MTKPTFVVLETEAERSLGERSVALTHSFLSDVAAGAGNVSNTPNQDNPQEINTLDAVSSTKVLFGSEDECTTVLPVREAASEPMGVSFAVRLPRTLFYKYQKVTDRKIVPFQPNAKKNPGYLLAYVVETLECGHKIVVHPIDGEHLTARRRCCHECSGLFGGVPLKKPAGKAKQGQRGRATGKVNWPAVVFALCSAAAIALVLIVKTPTTKILSAPETYVRVLRQYNTYDFQLQEVVNGVPRQPSAWHFCHDFVPQLEAGYTLTQLKWFENGACSEIAPRYIHHAYHIERDKGGLPTVPRNCINTSDQPVFCNGEPKF